MSRIPLLLLLLLLFLLGIFSTLVSADGIMIEGRHQFISVVPAPGPVVIDGKLDDWDLSGEILTYENPEFAAKRHARTALMYDKDYLYVSAFFKSSKPMHHLLDGRVDAELGWDGDCLQLRINTDPSVGYPLKITETKPIGRDIQIWYCDAPGRNEPQMSIHLLSLPPNGGRLEWGTAKNYFGADAQTAFQKLDDGYILESRIPWQRLGMPGPPAPGTKLAFTSQHIWANETGLKYGTSINDVNAPGGGFTYQSAAGWGYLLFEPKGHLAGKREELPKPVEVARTLSFRYTLPEACKVSIGVFDAQRQLVRTLLTAADRPSGAITEEWDGLNDFGDVLPAGNYTFKALTSLGFKQDFVVSVLNSGTPPWVTADGTGSWGMVGVPTDIACAGDRIYLLWGGGEGGENLQACTLEGKKLWGQVPYGVSSGFADALATDGVSLFIAQGVGVSQHDAASGNPRNFSGNQRVIEIPGGGISELAVLDGHLYVLAKGIVHDILLAQGKIVRTLMLGDGARGLKVAPEGKALLSLRDGALCRLHLDSGVVDNLFPVEMGKPFGLVLAPNGNRVYISDQGRLQNDIRVYSYPQGKPLGIIGKPGGRPAIGKFDPNGLFMPGRMAFDSNSRLWVAEMDTTPNRFSVWQTTGSHGTLVRDFFGPATLSGGTEVDPAQPENVYINNTRWIVDYDKHTAKIDCTFCRPNYYGPQPWAGGQEFVHVHHARGRTFLYSSNCVWEMLNDHAVPVWATGYNWPRGLWVWSDKNHDGYMQEDEMEKDSGPGLGHWRGQDMQDDLTMEHNSQGSKIMYLRPLAGWVDGLPVWEKASELKPVLTTQEMTYVSRWNPGMTRCYTLESNDGYYHNDMRRNGIACYTADGTRLWRYKAGIGMDANAPITKTGEIRGAELFIGFVETGANHAGEVFGVNGYFGNYNLLNEDGLFVTELCQDYRRGVSPGPNFSSCENFNGYIFRHPKTKKVYLTGGDIDGRFWEISGFDKLKRFNGELRITDKDEQSATRALADYRQAVGTRVTRFTLARMATPPALDGALASWNFSKAMKIEVTPGRGGKALAAYDDKYLYVAYRVASDTPFLNKGADPALLFKTGDLVDVILDTNTGADPNRKVGKGDTRIMFAPFQGKPIAVVMQKVAQGGPPAPMTYTSSQQPETLERVAILKEAKIGVKITADGYTLEAAVPLAAIGFTPEKGKEYPFDFGILYGDTSGATTIVRAYWTNQETQITNDAPTESRIQPANLGTAVVE